MSRAGCWACLLLALLGCRDEPAPRVTVVDSAGVRVTVSVDTSAAFAGLEDYMPEPMRPEYLSALRNELLPSLLPAYDRVLAAPDGHVWAQVFESDLGAAHDWDVFDARMRFVGQVHVAGGFYPMAITTDGAVGVLRDPMGVEYVRAYRLIRF